MVEVDSPFRFNEQWTYDYPFTWETEQREDGSYTFSYFADKQGYNKKNFNEMVGHPVAIKIDAGQWNTMMMNPVDELIHKRLEDNSITIDDIDVEKIKEYDIELPESVVSHSEIVMENNPWEEREDWR